MRRMRQVTFERNKTNTKHNQSADEEFKLLRWWTNPIVKKRKMKKKDEEDSVVNRAEFHQQIKKATKVNGQAQAAVEDATHKWRSLAESRCLWRGSQCVCVCCVYLWVCSALCSLNECLGMWTKKWKKCEQGKLMIAKATQKKKKLYKRSRSSLGMIHVQTKKATSL